MSAANTPRSWGMHACPEGRVGCCAMASSTDSLGVLNAGGTMERWSETVVAEMIKKETNRVMKVVGLIV